jgi:phosphoribosylformylglycinamidine synthase subunit PurQ / glutaminase
MRASVIVFPGSNCDRDCADALERVTGVAPRMVWHGETDLPPDTDLVLLPGGFSYGDYLRSGAIAANSPIMAATVRHAHRGGLVVGICNGFQILTEAGLLPGALMRNEGRRYVCRDVELEITNPETPFTRAYSERTTVMPVGNGDGRFVADDSTLDRLEGEGLVVFRYKENPNGSMRDIAGICNNAGNVLGLMPHPDRCADRELGRAGGWDFFQSLVAAHSPAA